MARVMVLALLCLGAIVANASSCSPNTCNTTDSHATCTSGGCQCSLGFYWDPTGTWTCRDYNSCQNAPCTINDVLAQCFDERAPSMNHRCVCSEGFQSNNETCVNYDACADLVHGNICRSSPVLPDNGAVCFDKPPPSTGHSCQCSAAYVEVDGVCTFDAPCEGDCGVGSCLAGLCVCEPHWTGDACDHRLSNRAPALVLDVVGNSLSFEALVQPLTHEYTPVLKIYDDSERGTGRQLSAEEVAVAVTPTGEVRLTTVVAFQNLSNVYGWRTENSTQYMTYIGQFEVALEYLDWDTEVANWGWEVTVNFERNVKDDAKVFVSFRSLNETSIVRSYLVTAFITKSDTDLTPRTDLIWPASTVFVEGKYTEPSVTRELSVRNASIWSFRGALIAAYDLSALTVYTSPVTSHVEFSFKAPTGPGVEDANRLTVFFSVGELFEQHELTMSLPRVVAAADSEGTDPDASIPPSTDVEILIQPDSGERKPDTTPLIAIVGGVIGFCLLAGAVVCACLVKRGVIQVGHNKPPPAAFSPPAAAAARTDGPPSAAAAATQV